MAPETKIKICEKLEKSSAEAEMKAYLLGKLDALNEAQAAELLGILTEEENLTEEALARKKSEVQIFRLSAADWWRFGLIGS